MLRAQVWCQGDITHIVDHLGIVCAGILLGRGGREADIVMIDHLSHQLLSLLAEFQSISS